jgi:uncharacterized protein (TIGR00730 family)
MKNTNKKICVFCGASKGLNPLYAEIARQVAHIFLEKKITLVYGGAKVGLMGELADTMMAGGGEVIGVMPKFLFDREVAHTDITKLHVVDTMSERKNLLMAISDGFITLPGGIGSLDEFFEVLTLAQLGQHNKPSGVLNVAHYYDDLLRFMQHSVAENFWNSTNHNRVIVNEDPRQLIESVLHFNAPVVNRWSVEVETG